MNGIDLQNLYPDQGAGMCGKDRVYSERRSIDPIYKYIHFFFFYLAKKTWTIIEGIEYAFFEAYLFVFDCKIDANTFLPIFSFLGNVFSREYVLLEIPLTPAKSSGGSWALSILLKRI